MHKKIVSGTLAAILLVVPTMASAHVVVKPAQVGVGSYETFTTAVPVEKDMATVGVRLVIPAGLAYVQPNTKPGWTIDEKTTGGGEFPTVTEISWTGGSIPAGQRDDFLFAPQAPAKPTSLHWKAYQTYADGTVVAWDQTPDGKDSEGSTPYSETKVVNDLATSAKPAANQSNSGIAIAAFVISLVALVATVGAALFGKKK